MRVVFVAIAIVALTGCLGTPASRGPSARVGRDVVLPPSLSIDAVRETCRAAAGPALVDCFLRALEQAGAPPASVQFARRLDQPGIARALRSVGPIDLVDVEFPFRANEQRAWFLVNGHPPLIDVDDQAPLARESLSRDATYTAIARAVPDVALWPGDRGDTASPDVERRADGTYDVVVAYRLRNGCHACAVVGTAWFAFTFDARGAFQGTSVAGATQSPPGTGALSPTTPGRPIATRVGREFRLTLASNVTTGYSWALRRSPDTRTLRLVERRYHAPTTVRPGAGGLESWTFGALREGTAEIELVYSRPWERDTPPARIETFTVIVGPR